jgi:hypothetical protein
MSIKKTLFKRICRRCEKEYLTEHRHSIICKDCYCKVIRKRETLFEANQQNGRKI